MTVGQLIETLQKCPQDVYVKLAAPASAKDGFINLGRPDEDHGLQVFVIGKKLETLPQCVVLLGANDSHKEIRE